MDAWRKEDLRFVMASRNSQPSSTIRSITPALLSPTDDENESMSSGDESDDEDLTDADSSGSEWSEFMNGECQKT